MDAAAPGWSPFSSTSLGMVIDLQLLLVLVRRRGRLLDSAGAVVAGLAGEAHRDGVNAECLGAVHAPA